MEKKNIKSPESIGFSEAISSLERSQSSEPILLPVVETFTSINGEGMRSGELALFIRFRGCNLSCNYCDTTWANSEDAPATMYTLEELVELVCQSGVKNVTLTGGEPMLQPHFGALVDALLDGTDCDIEVETNGSQSIEAWREAETSEVPETAEVAAWREAETPEHEDLASQHEYGSVASHRKYEGATPACKYGERLSFTLDYKLPDSGMEQCMHLPNYGFLCGRDTVKFVCQSDTDLDKARSIIDRYHLTETCNVFLSPVFGKIDPAHMVEYMIAHRMNRVRLQLQMHKFIWDPEKRGV